MTDNQPRYSDKQLQTLFAKLREQEQEIRSLKTHLKCYALPTTYKEFVNEIWAKNKAIGELLHTAHVRRFDNPRLWLDFEDPTPEQRVIIAFQLKRFLKLWTAGKFGNPFHLKIRILDRFIPQ